MLRNSQLILVMFKLPLVYLPLGVRSQVIYHNHANTFNTRLGFQKNLIYSLIILTTTINTTRYSVYKHKRESELRQN